MVACTTIRATPVHATESAAGEARAEARSLADQGADAYARGSFARAQALFARAYALVPAPTIALFEARALVQLRRLVDARAAYVRASSTPTASDAPAPYREAVKDAAAELVELDRRIPRYRVVIEGNAEIAANSVSVDGRPVPKSSTDSWLRADLGAHELRFIDAGGKHSLLRFELREGDAKTLRIDAEGDSSNPARTLGTLSTAGYGVGAAGVVAGAILVLGSPSDSKPRVALSTSLRDVKLEGTF